MPWSNRATVLLKAAEAETDADGWATPAGGRLVTLYSASQGVGLTINRVEALRKEGGLISARTSKGDVYVLSLEALHAGAVDGATAARQAGFRG